MQPVGAQHDLLQYFSTPLEPDMGRFRLSADSVVTARQSHCHDGARSVCPSVCLSVRLSVRLTVCLTVCLSVCPSICLSVLLSVYPSVCLSVCLSACLSVCRFLASRPAGCWLTKPSARPASAAPLTDCLWSRTDAGQSAPGAAS